MEKIALLEALAPMIAVGIVSLSIGWVTTTWLRIRNGYPLESGWGKPLYPKSLESEERVKLLTQENAQLRAELGSLKDRLGNVERIVTDSGYQLTSEIESLRAKQEAN
ncbi:hypothetical protein [Qipengyuania sp. NPDC077563]|uniref:hypothetical protein n=1 Tax=Qipengyuania sp. NPDC077563 TaxID=3364497 RepID=UPI00384E8CD9